MRHSGYIRNDNLTGNILPDAVCQIGGFVSELIRINQFPKHNSGRLFVRNLNSHGSLSRNRCLNPDVGSRQVKHDIILQAEDPADLDSHLRDQFIACYRRPADDIGDFYIYTEGFEYFGQLGRGAAKFFLRCSVSVSGRIFQQRNRREDVFRFYGLLPGRNLLLHSGNAGIDIFPVCFGFSGPFCGCAFRRLRGRTLSFFLFHKVISAGTAAFRLHKVIPCRNILFVFDRDPGNLKI